MPQKNNAKSGFGNRATFQRNNTTCVRAPGRDLAVLLKNASLRKRLDNFPGSPVPGSFVPYEGGLPTLQLLLAMGRGVLLAAIAVALITVLSRSCCHADALAVRPAMSTRRSTKRGVGRAALRASWIDEQVRLT